MKPKNLFTENELSILKVLWGTTEPLSKVKVLERITAQKMNSTSFHVGMNSLIEKGYAGVAGFERCGTNYGRTYIAAKTRADFIVDLLSTTRPTERDQDQDQNCVTEIMMAFVQNGQIREETIAKLEAMLADYHRALEQEAHSPEQKEEQV